MAFKQKQILFYAEPMRLRQGVALIRIVVGLLLLYHGQEVFDPGLMKEYAGWEVFAGPNASLLVYIGKTSELLAGILLIIGLCTRLAAFLVIATLSYITFIIGNGRFWYEDQHPFLFVLFGLLFFFTGPGAWSVDSWICSSKRPG